ncbi:MAG TPA: hypothetical protein ENN23_06485 [Deltaproteobacteria bacterium]|nr:hypothetical protein [Deltaproteobacteria bacterium]
MNIIISILSFVIANPLKRMKQSLRTSFVIASVAKQSLFLSLRKAVSLVAISFFFLALPCLAFAEEKIPVFPTTPVEAYTVYGSLALFWLAIIFLIIVIKMKLNEIERIQKLGIDEEDKNAPVLE